ncbi:MAG: transposase [Candidatus Micrarchaeota archaeon]
MARRAKLQSLNAIKALHRLKRKEKNFVKTNLGQVVKQIIALALKYDCEIAVEDLKKFKPLGKNFNREAMRIPFALFKTILEARCFDNNIPLNIVDSWHTSKWCSHCGAVENGHSSNYSLFKCKNCGQTVNSDRKASLAIAIKCLLERKNVLNQQVFQFSGRRVPVNGLLFSNESVIMSSVNHSLHLRKAPCESKR